MTLENRKPRLEIYIKPITSQAGLDLLDQRLRARIAAGVVHENQDGLSLPKINRLDQHEVIANPRHLDVAGAIIYDSGFYIERIVELPTGREVKHPIMETFDLMAA